MSSNEVGGLDLTFSTKASMDIPQKPLGIGMESEQMSIYLSLTHPHHATIQQKILLLCVCILGLVDFYFLRENGRRNVFLSACNY